MYLAAGMSTIFVQTCAQLHETTTVIATTYLFAQNIHDRIRTTRRRCAALRLSTHLMSMRVPLIARMVVLVLPMRVRVTTTTTTAIIIAGIIRSTGSRRSRVLGS